MTKSSFRKAVMAVDGNEDMMWFGTVKFVAAEPPSEHQVVAEAKRIAREAGMLQDRIEALTWKVMPD